jgi:hypothetical protein
MKTLAIRLEDEQHARLTILARISGVSVTDAIRTAVETYIATVAGNPDVSAKAEAVLAEIEREASEQRAAIAGLFGSGGEATPRPTRTTKS